MWSVAENDRYALTEDKCCGRPKRCNAKMIRGGGTRCQRNEIDGIGCAYVASFGEFEAREGFEYQAWARPAWVRSRRKSGAETSMVRHISKRRERMRLPMRSSRESSRTAGMSLPPGPRVASPADVGLSR